jgi:protein-S-isoprenylcysteine O-methyltransferase Ste14
MPEIADERTEERVLHIPLWFLQLESKINKSNRRGFVLFIYLFIGLYALIPVLQPQFGVNIADVLVYYTLFYIGYFILLIILWKLYFIKIKLKKYEKFSYSLFRLHLTLQKIIFDESIDVPLKKGISSLLIDLKRMRLGLDEDSISKCIKNLNKINLLVRNIDKNRGYLISLSNKLFNMGSSINNEKKINIESVEKEFKLFSENLENIQIIGIVERVLPIKKHVVENFTIYGFIFLVFVAISSYMLPEHRFILIAIFAATLAFWLNRTFRK